MKLIIFDLDGTIISGFGVGTKALNQAFWHVYGVEGALDGISLSGKVDSEIIREAIEANQLEKANVNDVLVRYEFNLSKLLREDKDAVSALPGAHQLLETLAKKGHKLAVATGNARSCAIDKLEHSTLAGFFEVGSFGDEVSDRKELIKMAYENAKEHFGIDFGKEDVYVLGDTLLDITGAKDNGFHSVALLNGHTTREQIAKVSPEAIFENMNDFMALVRHIGGEDIE